MKYKYSITKFNDSFLLIKENWNKYEELNNITDYFSEIVRIQCNFKNCISPFKYWTGHRTFIEGDNATIKMIRDKMYDNVKFCNNFRISIALTLFDLFKANIILDPSAGWGDRLIAAIGYDVKNYVGVDPNNELHPCYNEIIKTLVAPKCQSNFIMINDGFEKANIPKLNYDLVFTSPPFFDLEKYSSNTNDSIVAHPSVDDWFKNFLLVLIKKSFNHLIIGGHFVLYISESSNTQYIDKMITYANSLMKMLGSIYYFYDGSYVPRRIMVWKKL